MAVKKRPATREDDGPTGLGDYNGALEMRTVAGPSRHVQWTLSGGPCTVWVACAAGPCCVSAAVAEAGLMPHEYFAGTETMAVRATRRRAGDPRPDGRLD